MAKLVFGKGEKKIAAIQKHFLKRGIKINFYKSIAYNFTRFDIYFWHVICSIKGKL